MKSLSKFAVFALSFAVSAVATMPAQAVTTDEIMSSCTNYAIAGNYFMKQRQNNVPKSVVEKEFKASSNIILSNPNKPVTAVPMLKIMEGYMNDAYNTPVEKTSAKKTQAIADNHVKLYKFCMGKTRHLVK